MRFLTFLLLLLSFVACQNETTTTPDNYSGPLFSAIPPTESGVTFSNKVPQDSRRNILFYEYYLNGGGVVTADFNKDGLPDLFFTSNLDADQLYINKGGFQFVDITKEAGVEGWREGNRQSWSTGATITDVNNDGWLDIYVCKSGAYQNPANKANLLYINNGTKKMKGVKGVTFSEKSVEYGIHDTGHSIQAVFFDYDKDKDLDLYVMNHSILYKEDILTVNSQLNDDRFVNQFSGQFYKNENGKYIKNTLQVGMNRYGFGLGLMASDFNHDGFTDIYVSNDFSESDFMFMNNGNGTFSDKIKENIKHTPYYGMGIDAADINNDGLIDICNLDMAATTHLVSKTSMPFMDTKFFNTLISFFKHSYQYMYNTLQLNQGNGKFSDIAKLAGIHKTDWSWGVLIADFDNDGFKDMFVSNGYKANFMNNDFITEFKQMKDLWGVISEDEKMGLINRIPTYKTPNVLLKNKENLTFQRMNQEWGMEEPTYSYGSAYVDLDLDGDLDLVTNNMDSAAGIYRNNTLNTNYLQIELLDKGTHLPATCWNAKVTIHTLKGIQYQELTPVRGYQASVEPILHFGLGNTSTIDKIEVEWQDGKTQVIDNVKANQRISIDKSNAKNITLEKEIAAPIFNIEINPGDIFRHQENSYDDFAEELLLPHKNSRHGPAAAKADVNGDGLEDYYVGGASQQVGGLFFQTPDGQFKLQPSNAWQQDYACEDVGSAFFDIDNDGDQDLYVVSGGNEFSENSIYLEDRIYINDGKGNFTKNNALLPPFKSSGSDVVAADFNGDGWQDVFVGGRMQVGQYPLPAQSKLLINQNGKLTDQTQQFAPELENVGIITSAEACDFNADGKMDLVIAGEWTPIYFFENTGTRLVNNTPSDLVNQTGWWSALSSADFDKDGDIDFVIGNLGLNYKYSASESEPFHIYYADFDASGTSDIVLGYYNKGTCFPVRGRECSSQQMPFIKDKFPTFQSFGEASLYDVYGDQLEQAFHLQATNFSSVFLRNEGNGTFKLMPLPMEAQISCINGFVIDDFNRDGNLDVLLAGNMYDSEVETPRNDAGVGLCLLGNGKGKFTPLPPINSGFFADGNVKDLISLKGRTKNWIIAINNNSYTSNYIW